MLGPGSQKVPEAEVGEDCMVSSSSSSKTYGELYVPAPVVLVFLAYMSIEANMETAWRLVVLTKPFQSKLALQAHTIGGGSCRCLSAARESSRIPGLHGVTTPDVDCTLNLLLGVKLLLGFIQLSLGRDVACSRGSASIAFEAVLDGDSECSANNTAVDIGSLYMQTQAGEDIESAVGDLRIKDCTVGGHVEAACGQLVIKDQIQKKSLAFEVLFGFFSVCVQFVWLRCRELCLRAVEEAREGKAHAVSQIYEDDVEKKKKLGER